MDKDVKAIIERLEAASGPDRKIDAAIARLFDLPLCIEPDCFPDVLAKIIDRVERGEWDQDPDVKFYTYSIDAALSLVPEGFSYELTKSAAGEFSRARLWDWKRGPLAFDPDNNWVSEGNRPLTLNLVIAALRARAHKGEG